MLSLTCSHFNTVLSNQFRIHMNKFNFPSHKLLSALSVTSSIQCKIKRDEKNLHCRFDLSLFFVTLSIPSFYASFTRTICYVYVKCIEDCQQLCKTIGLDTFEMNTLFVSSLSWMNWISNAEHTYTWTLVAHAHNTLNKNIAYACFLHSCKNLVFVCFNTHTQRQSTSNKSGSMYPTWWFKTKVGFSCFSHLQGEWTSSIPSDKPYAT